MTCPIKHPTCHRETEANCPTRLASGDTVCNLGRPTVVYQLRIRDDGQATVTLSIFHRTFLAYLAKLGGESSMDWTSAENQRARKGPQTIEQEMKPLFEMGLLTETPIVGTGRVLLRLTDAGRNVVSQMGVKQ